MPNRRVWGTSDDGLIEYSSLTNERLPEFLQVLKEHFFPYENVCMATGISSNPEAIAEFDQMSMDIAKEGVSLIAIDSSTGNIAGVLLNKIQGKDSNAKEYYEEYKKRAKHPETKFVCDFMILMEDSLDPLGPYNADCFMDLKFLGVNSKYGRRGIGTDLVEASVQMAKSLFEGKNVKTSLDGIELALEPRPQVVSAVFTALKSQRIGRKLQFDLVKTISYADIYAGGRSYASVLGEETKFMTLECKSLRQ